MAFVLTLAYAFAVAPGWEPRLNDQQQYLALARGFVERGAFTRAASGEPFIPETLRLPGYPLLIAPTCVGGCDHWRIAVLQALLFAALVVAAWLLARRAIRRRATLVALLVAVYLPFAYYGALALSDLPAAALVAFGVVAWLRGDETGATRWSVVAGLLLGWAGLMRASLLLLPAGLSLLSLRRGRAALPQTLACALAAAIVFAPYVAYSEREFGRPIGANAGAVLWIGALQFREEASLDPTERSEVEAARAEIAAFDAMTDRVARALAWLRLDDDLGSRARALIAHDPIGWIGGAVPRSIELWGGDAPVPGGASGALAIGLIAVQLALFLLGSVGTLRLARSGSIVGVVAAGVIAYVWITAVPFQTEGRYALPARLFLLLGAVAALEPWRRSS